MTTPPRFSGLAFPCPGKRRKQTKAKATAPEAAIQAGVEAYLRMKGLAYIHIPAYLLNAAFSPRFAQGGAMWAMKRAADEIRGIPDLFVFDEAHPGAVLVIELKTPVGRLTAAQERWLAVLGGHVCRSVEDAVAVVETWRARL